MFNLVDETGAWIRCVALDRNAKYDCLAEGQEVILWFGLGRPPLKSFSGAVYAMKEALIVGIEMKAKRSKFIEIRIEQ